MEALAKAVAGLLVRGGWLLGLILLETLLLTGFWWSGPTPFGDAFDRRAAEADLLLLTITSLPALFAGALLAAGDREDGMADFYRSCRVSPLTQVMGSWAGVFLVTGGALIGSLILSLVLATPPVLLTGSPWVGLGLGLLSCAIHGAWGLALGSWVRSRWTAVTAALVFWILTLFALEGLVTALLGVVPTRWTLPILLGFLATNPSEFVRILTVFVRGQSWAYGAAFAPVRDAIVTLPGVIAVVAVSILHLGIPLLLAMGGWRRRTR